MLLALNSVSHFLVDALCIATLFGPVSLSVESMAFYIVLYNTLAFSTQCITGLFADALRHHSHFAAFSILLVIFGYLLPVPALAKVCLIGIGNSIFHVAGGAMTLETSNGKANKLGVFVAPGAFGVTLGSLFPQLAFVYIAAAFICTGIYIYICFNEKNYPVEKKPEIKTQARFPLAVIIVLTFAVAVRAVGGSAVSFPWKSGAALSILMTFFVFAGKATGGFICDKIGATKTAWISIPLSAIFIAFFSDSMLPSFAGQFLLNLSMPVTLWLMYKALPDSPGFSFGLAASALWPGTIAGQLFTLTGPALWICVAACFIFGLAAIIYADKRSTYIKKGG